MITLEKSLRNRLEHSVREAREIAEEAARAALGHLGVGESVRYNHLTNELRDLRRRLRIHGRQLGDFRDPKSGKQQIDRLTEEVAYEHWHRMLFAKFLAENNLLMYPDPDQPIPVTLEECEDLAKDEGARNGWELAARYSARMLPQIFRPDSPVFELILPPEHQIKLERLLSDLPAEVFTALDSLGWVYQFWQAKKKDEVNASEVKIGARELPAVTQLFTEPYMVAFLLDNSLGAWWASRRLTKDCLKNVETEEELRQKAALPGVPLEYLRFVRDRDENWTPAAGKFDTWPKSLAELKVMDPCCGSGHFLVAALLMLAPMRMELEGLSAQEAVDAVLRDNIHGLEIDDRCVELAAFALALTAWRYAGAREYRPLPQLNVACSGLVIAADEVEWTQFAGPETRIRFAWTAFQDLGKRAPLLGSLINPREVPGAQDIDWKRLAERMTLVLAQESAEEEREIGVCAQGLTKAMILLLDKYHLICTNVPYLARGKQDEDLKEFCSSYYGTAKNDIATVFLQRCIEFCAVGGIVSMVLPQNWLFLTSYKKFRENLLRANTWRLIARLGPHAFQTPMWDFNVQLLTLGRGKPLEFPLLRDTKETENPIMMRGLDASEPRNPVEKAELLKNAELREIEQEKQLDNPDARITLETSDNQNLLSAFAVGAVGIQTGDYPRFVCNFWELTKTDDWEGFQTTVPNTRAFGGLSQYIRYQQGKGALRILAASEERDRRRDKQGQAVWGRPGIAVSCMRHIPVAMYLGTKFDNNVAIVAPHNPSHVPALWCFCSAPEYSGSLRQIDQKLNITNATLVKIPFDLEHWSKVAAEKYPSGLPRPYSDDPTQWIFHGYPAKSEYPLHVAVARLLGYRWPAELETDMDLSEEARMWIGKSRDLVPYADKDGIVCIPHVGGETSAADRLHNLLAAAYGDQWTTAKLSELLAEVDHGGKTLDSWIRDNFFIQHCKLFHDRPFIWHIWDGLRDGFSALVNYHKLDKKKLEALIYTYLGDWVRRQKNDLDSGADGAEERLSAAENLKKKLELIVEGEAPHDIFVRWKSIEQQPVGWEPDLNDGVRLNIRPFMSVPDVGKKGAGVLRDKPNIKWTKDRGKDVDSAPWYDLFKGDRVNDHHLTPAEKRAAREARGGQDDQTP